MTRRGLDPTRSRCSTEGQAAATIRSPEYPGRGDSLAIASRALASSPSICARRRSASFKTSENLESSYCVMPSASRGSYPRSVAPAGRRTKTSARPVIRWSASRSPSLKEALAVEAARRVVVGVLPDLAEGATGGVRAGCYRVVHPLRPFLGHVLRRSMRGDERARISQVAIVSYATRPFPGADGAPRGGDMRFF